MASLAQIRDVVSEFLFGSIEANELAERFEPMLEGAEHAGEINALELANNVELRLARFFDGYISESSLRVQLNSLIPTPSAAPLIFVQNLVISAELPNGGQQSSVAVTGALSPSFGPVLAPFAAPCVLTSCPQ